MSNKFYVKKIFLVFFSLFISSFVENGCFGSDLSEEIEKFFGIFKTPVTSMEKIELYGIKVLDSIPDETLPSFQKPLNTTSVKYQDVLGTCASFAVCGCIEALNLSKSIQIDVSEAFFTVITEKYADDNKFGLSIGDAIAGARDKGFVDEKHWLYDNYVRKVCKKNKIPYDDIIYGEDGKPLYGEDGKPLKKTRWDDEFKDDWKTASTDVSHKVDFDKDIKEEEKLYMNGIFLYTADNNREEYINKNLSKLYKGTKFDAIRGDNTFNSIKSIKQKLSKGIPVFINVPMIIKANWRTKDKKTGHIKIPTFKKSLLNDELKSPDKKEGNHMVLLTGYNDDVEKADARGGYFYFKNSWSDSWALGYQDEKKEVQPGHGTIPYAYIEYFSWEAAIGELSS